MILNGTAGGKVPYVRIASVQIGVTWPAASVGLGVTLEGRLVAVTKFPVAVMAVALRSIVGVAFCGTVGVSVTEMTGVAVSVAGTTGEARVAVAVSVTEP